MEKDDEFYSDSDWEASRKIDQALEGLKRLSDAFSAVGNETVSAELWDIADVIEISVNTLKENDRKRTKDQLGRVNNQIGDLFTTILNKEN